MESDKVMIDLEVIRSLAESYPDMTITKLLECIQEHDTISQEIRLRLINKDDVK